MPHLRVSAGPSLSSMEPITDIVNAGKSHPISSPFFEGDIAANIKGFVNESGEQVPEGPYFSKEGKDGITWSIQVRGRFLIPISADDVLFGNTFERPLKLPWGTSAALKFANYIDPTLTHDLTSATKPWALSPLISTMPYFAHKRIREDEDSGPFPPVDPIQDSTPQLHFASTAHRSNDSVSSSSSSGSASSRASNSSPPTSAEADPPKIKVRPSLQKIRSVASLRSLKNSQRARSKQANQGFQFTSASQRRSHFANAEARKEIMFTPRDEVTTDFCYGFFNFYPTIALRIPGGIEFDLMHYWDKQPVRFVCCAKKGWVPAPEDQDDVLDTEEDEDTPWGRVFWCIALELVDDAPDM